MSKRKNNKKAWEVLTEDEKAALLLSIEYNKSTWQAGEIMGKAHYKYLEIQARANKFFRMFHEYFEATGNLRIPDNCYIDPTFRDYIIHTVFERKTGKEAISIMGNTSFIVSNAKERIISECLEQLANNEDVNQQLLYDLITEFDRWNNFRILPTSLQEPSAFKRRNKMRLIKHLKNLSNLDEFHIRRFIKKFKAKAGKKSQYITVLSPQFEGGYQVVAILDKKNIIEHISKHLRLYIFKEHVDADNFGFLVNQYLQNEKKDCKVGQKFWPRYRKLIEIASNYLEVNNIIPRRKHLEKALRDFDEINMRKQDNKVIDHSDAQPRAKVDKFWNI